MLGKVKNAVRFDGFKDGVFLEAKGFYQGIFKAGKADPKKVFDNMQGQLSRQIDAAKGGKLEWHFAEQSTMEQFKKHLGSSEKGKELLKKVSMQVTKYEAK